MQAYRITAHYGTAASATCCVRLEPPFTSLTGWIDWLFPRASVVVSEPVEAPDMLTLAQLQPHFSVPFHTPAV